MIIDPISAYMGGGPRFDSHRNTDVRRLLAPLSDLAARTGVAVIAVTHLRKGEGAAMYRAMGSLAFVAAARTVLAVAKDQDDECGRRRLMLPVKCNIAVEPKGLSFELRREGNTAVVAWFPQPVEVSADEALAPPKRKSGPEPEARSEAEGWLRKALANGPRLARELYEDPLPVRRLENRDAADVAAVEAALGLRAVWRPTAAEYVAFVRSVEEWNAAVGRTSIFGVYAD